MKYWIFQNNQVLGPYEPDEMCKISVFSPESLVCPEGRRGTSMGDWQRAGMVPDLSVALVRASSSGEGRTAVLSIAGLPPEPTLKDLAQLGSIQEKVAMLEEVVLQLQEGLRAKDAELSSVHQALAGKSLEASEIKGEAASRQREAEELKRQISGLEDRLSSVRLLSETLDKAVEEERRVEQDVEKQGQTITDLARDVEELRRQLEESKTRQAEIAAAPQISPIDLPTPSQAIALPTPVSFDLPKETDIFPPPPPPPPPPAASAMPVPAPIPVPVPSPATPMDFPTMNTKPLPSFDAGMTAMPSDAAAGFTPPAFGDSVGGALAPSETPVPAVEAIAVGVIPPPPAPKGKKALMIGVLVGLAALGGLAVMGGYVPGLRKPQAPAAVLAPTPLPPPEPLPVPVVPAPDSRQLAIEFAKAWPLPGDRTLERALENLAPSAGNLSPWMAEPLAGGRVQLNYFARSTAPGAPTIAYEFEVDLEGKTLIGRNAAAKSVLTGKASAPPAPPKPKPVKVKPKAAPAKKAPEEDTLDSMLGDAPVKGGGTTLTDTGDAPAAETDLAPPEEAVAEPAPKVKPHATRAKPASRAAKAKTGKPPAKEQPADESLLDDLLKE